MFVDRFQVSFLTLCLSLHTQASQWENPGPPCFVLLESSNGTHCKPQPHPQISNSKTSHYFALSNHFPVCLGPCSAFPKKYQCVRKKPFLSPSWYLCGITSLNVQAKFGVRGSSCLHGRIIIHYFTNHILSDALLIFS